ncbi:MAG: AAA family ATPase [Haliscomenobacter sp.]|uniref:AAA family ATPase n=1 Tax=Haliscomenobacter sp. TaxID=2717303 RepID=UPI0029A7BB98|nr:AAA family ATPase [Haliscomenobacter sp.]MDX2072450.1 AAA family ATPase [Haliscomenobacter sp.]
MLKIPYGESDFTKLRVEDYFYQDRTHFIEKLEQWNSNYPVFLRPRRFGKSLFISMLHHYYGLEFQADFQTLFGGLYIGEHPSPHANSYFVLSFEFSRIDTSSQESTYTGFLRNVVSGARRFFGAYSSYYTEEQKKSIEFEKSPEAVINAIFDFTEQNKIPYKIYLLIDEYDHFANELLSFDLNRFKENVSRNGFVRKFYESLKTATRDGIVDRIFITGVSPITLDSLTSGFNISDNISLNPIFHNMMGFTHEEVKALLGKAAIPQEKIPDMMHDLQDWYNGYRFTNQVNIRLFNPDMVLYFLKEYGIMGYYPEVMLDTNVISDYRKVRNIFKIGGAEEAKFELLENLVEKGHIDFPLTRLYNLEAEFTQDDFLSLLFYMGMLSFKELADIGWRFEIPNYVIKKLYFEYFTAIFLDKTKFAKTKRPIAQTISALISQGNPEPFFKIVEYVLAENHSNRDELSYGEKHLQTLMIGLLFPYESYFIHSEYEARKGYPDIYLEKMPNRPVKYDIVLELKYVKKSAQHTLEKVTQQAAQQLNEYMTSERFSRPDVRGFYVVFLGGEVYQWKEWS